MRSGYAFLVAYLLGNFVVFARSLSVARSLRLSLSCSIVPFQLSLLTYEA